MTSMGVFDFTGKNSKYRGKMWYTETKGVYQKYSLKNQMERQQQVKSGQFFDPANPIQQCGSVNIYQLGSMEQCPFVGQIAETDQLCRDCGKLHFIPCTSHGLNFSCIPGVYDAVDKEIEKMSKELF